MAAEMESAVLKALAAGPIEDTIAFASSNKYAHDALIGVIKSLQTDFYVTGENMSRSFFVTAVSAIAPVF